MPCAKNPSQYYCGKPSTMSKVTEALKPKEPVRQLTKATSAPQPPVSLVGIMVPESVQRLLTAGGSLAVGLEVWTLVVRWVVSDEGVVMKAERQALMPTLTAA
jgi:hypothetical protein